MLDETTRQMLDIALLLSAQELDQIRAEGQRSDRSMRELQADPDLDEPATTNAGDHEDCVDVVTNTDTDTDTNAGAEPSVNNSAPLTMGERERQRTRESKVSTACVGKPREAHEWWPIGTVLIGRIGPETFHAEVVENNRVKSGRSILITSGAAKGATCITPTRAAIEATEAYRQTHDLGRGGGVTNGWTFWKPRP